jgi:hypothetical protein
VTTMGELPVRPRLPAWLLGAAGNETGELEGGRGARTAPTPGRTSLKRAEESACLCCSPPALCPPPPTYSSACTPRELTEQSTTAQRTKDDTNQNTIPSIIIIYVPYK